MICKIACLEYTGLKRFFLFFENIHSRIYFYFSSGKENIPPMIGTPRHSLDSSNEQILPGN